MKTLRGPLSPIDNHPAAAAAAPLLEWYGQNARTLPWREDRNPYHVWLSEIMLQQTRVEAVIPYYYRFIEALPSISDLAAVSEERLLKLWEGLGYYSRARNLKKAAVVCMERYGGMLPHTYDELLKLPGFGPYTAAAVASIAFGQPVPAVDGNVLRVVSRLCAYGEDIMLPAVRKVIFNCLLPYMAEKPGELNQAFMDLGASICLPNGVPKCESCPVSFCCEAFLNGQERLFPVKRAKSARRIEERAVLLVFANGRVLLHRRKAQGLLAGLWEFPNFEGRVNEGAVLDYCSGVGIPVKNVRRLVNAKHIFTHIEWHMTGFAVEANEYAEAEGYVWAGADELQERYPLPSAFRAFKEAAETNLT